MASRRATTGTDSLVGEGVNLAAFPPPPLNHNLGKVGVFRVPQERWLCWCVRWPRWRRRRRSTPLPCLPEAGTPKWSQSGGSWQGSPDGRGACGLQKPTNISNTQIIYFQKKGLSRIWNTYKISPWLCSVNYYVYLLQMSTICRPPGDAKQWKWKL